MEKRRQRRARELALDAVDGEVHVVLLELAEGPPDEDGQRSLAVPRGGERVVGEGHVLDGGLAGRVRVVRFGLGGGEPDGRAVGAGDGNADGSVGAARAHRP